MNNGYSLMSIVVFWVVMLCGLAGGMFRKNLISKVEKCGLLAFISVEFYKLQQAYMPTLMCS
jgi:hypothetical protein